tara:strand:- start:3149 stop:3691 length:543 start_codon:yes stop_codon:yes gene_type:complete
MSWTKENINSENFTSEANAAISWNAESTNAAGFDIEYPRNGPIIQIRGGGSTIYFMSPTENASKLNEDESVIIKGSDKYNGKWIITSITPGATYSAVYIKQVKYDTSVDNGPTLWATFLGDEHHDIEDGCFFYVADDFTFDKEVTGYEMYLWGGTELKFEDSNNIFWNAIENNNWIIEGE